MEESVGLVCEDGLKDVSDLLWRGTNVAAT